MIELTEVWSFRFAAYGAEETWRSLWYSFAWTEEPVFKGYV